MAAQAVDALVEFVLNTANVNNFSGLRDLITDNGIGVATKQFTDKYVNNLFRDVAKLLEKSERKNKRIRQGKV